VKPLRHERGLPFRPRFLAEPRMWETTGPAGMADPLPKTSREKQLVIFDQVLASRAALIGQRIDLTMTVEPGHSLSLGQQFNVTCRIDWRPFQSPLFRAYIPQNGDPVHFDFYGEQMVAANGDEEMKERVLEFVRNPDVMNRLMTLRHMATH
jgi:hypothetical protein